jgi:hypothetical protein
MGKRFILVASLGLLSANAGWALPTLQLDIAPGVYNTSDETTYATSPNFTVRALYNGSSFSTKYYISAAIEPMLPKSTSPPNVGTFTIDGNSYSADILVWGDPPINVVDNANGTGPGNLPPHGMFPTYYAEIEFSFDQAHTVSAYNTADGTSRRGSLYYHDFVVDVSGLLPAFSVHFDLYDEAIKKFKKGSSSSPYTLDDFAPFSHDAQSGPHSVPDAGATAGLLGLGMLMVRLLRRQNERN